MSRKNQVELIEIAKAPKYVVKSLANIQSTLGTHETILSFTPAGSLSQGANFPGVLAITEDRLIFETDGGRMSFNKSLRIDLGTFTSFELEPYARAGVTFMLTMKELRICTSGGDHYFLLESSAKNYKAVIADFLDHLNAIGSAVEDQTESHVDVTDGLLQLSNLYASGLLTAAEFAKAKTRLLGS